MMKSTHKNPVPRQYYFISLKTRSGAPTFRDAFFKTKIERRWEAHIRRYPAFEADAFVVNDAVIHALLKLQAEREHSDRQLLEMLHVFQQQVQTDWKTEAQLWQDAALIRQIQDPAEYQQLRSFIIQKMLGSKTPTGLPELDDDGNDEDFRQYDN